MSKMWLHRRIWAYRDECRRDMLDQFKRSEHDTEREWRHDLDVEWGLRIEEGGWANARSRADARRTLRQPVSTGFRGKRFTKVEGHDLNTPLALL